MSETYTIGGDTWQPLVGFDISGQTFTPLESHIVNFLDLNLWLFSYTPPLISLWQCDAGHEPHGPELARGHVVEPLAYLPPAKRRVRFQLDTPVALNMGTIYAIQIRQALGHVGGNNLVLYDKDDATYPRGHIIFSDDGGNTWTHFHNSDFIFCEFGNPPLPSPDPVAPISYFACLALQYFHHPTSISFTLATSVPCHLDCYYTEVKPLVHPRERVIRGARLMDNSYRCFVAWKLVEQTEPGDTLYHTFEMPNWAYCQTKWFTFRGTIDEVISPSIGPIFIHHHTGPDLRLYQHYIIDDNTGHIIAATLWEAQTFLPTEWHYITKVKLKLYRVGTPGTLTVSIRAANVDKPIGTDRTIGITNANTLTTDPGGEWREIIFHTPYRLVPGVHYAIVARGLEVFPLNFIVWRAHDPGHYPGGMISISADSGATWLGGHDTDFMFEEWGYPI